MTNQDVRRAPDNPWIGISFDALRLGCDASTVIVLRTLRIAQGGEYGRAEAALMVQEKVIASLSLQAKAFSGGLGATAAGASAQTLDHYQREVSANLRRLTRT